MSRANNDKRLDTIASSIGFGVQVETTRCAGGGLHEVKFYPANGAQIHIFAGSSNDDGVHSPSESASVYLSKEKTDELIAVLQVHRARMEPVAAAVQS